MRIAIFSDIHANREAFEACLAHNARSPAERMVFLGDIVGYGADPEWCINVVREYCSRGALALLGNHDEAIFRRDPDMNEAAMAAIRWTRDRLEEEQANFLRALPMTHEEGEYLFVHASAAAPAHWNYVTQPRDAEKSLRYTQRRVTVCGHTHQPKFFHALPGRPAEIHIPRHGEPTPLLRQRRWVAVIGSVGQPRDGNPAAAYAVLDPGQGVLTQYRVPYDTNSAARKILAAGLPARLADRLHTGS